jgi:hypothetical protein
VLDHERDPVSPFLVSTVQQRGCGSDHQLVSWSYPRQVVTPLRPFSPPVASYRSRLTEGTRHGGLFWSGFTNSYGLFQDAGRSPVASQGNLTFSIAERLVLWGRLFQRGFDASHRVTTIVIVTHTTNDIVETPPVGFHGTIHLCALQVHDCRSVDTRPSRAHPPLTSSTFRILRLSVG